MPLSGSALKEPVQLSKLLAVGLKARLDETALVSLEDSWSWSELERVTDRLAANYLALGLRLFDMTSRACAARR
jgi:long-chain acyl-CoA synthetase